MSITDQPTILYLNQPYIDQQMQLANEGMVRETVEEYSETDTTSNSGGLKIYNVLNFMKEKSSEETENTAKNIQSTPIGRFALYHGLVDQSGDLTEVQSNSTVDLSAIQDGDFVSVTGKIFKSPINDLIGVLDKFGWSIAQIFEESSEDSNEISNQRLEAEFEDASDSYYIPMSDHDGAFHFDLNAEYFKDIGTNFPDSYTDYTVFAEVDHCFQKREKEYMVDIANFIPQNSREQQVELRKMWKKIAYGLNEFPGRDFSENEFYFSNPDVRLNPISVYK